MRPILRLNRLLGGDKPSEPTALAVDTEGGGEAELPSKGKDYWHSADILGDRVMTRIEHDGYIYILRVTKENRLILTK